MTLYSDTLASHSYRFKRLMLAYSNTEIEQCLRDARLLFEELNKILDSPTIVTDTYRFDIEMMVNKFDKKQNISELKSKINNQYQELKKELLTFE